ncbi:MAG: hypothetical protein JSS64_09000 [Bacteroidetes bacterium]|nr:hypothetical protein [Bacteroidota bacterium]
MKKLVILALICSFGTVTFAQNKAEAKKEKTEVKAEAAKTHKAEHHSKKESKENKEDKTKK